MSGESFEKAIAAQLRTIAVEHIQSEQISSADLSSRLGVASQTAQTLLSRPRWDVGLAMHVVDRLGLSVKVDRL